jgi:hypothetical protein
MCPLTKPLDTPQHPGHAHGPLTLSHVLIAFTFLQAVGTLALPEDRWRTPPVREKPAASLVDSRYVRLGSQEGRMVMVGDKEGLGDGLREGTGEGERGEGIGEGTGEGERGEGTGEGTGEDERGDGTGEGTGEGERGEGTGGGTGEGERGEGTREGTGEVEEGRTAAAWGSNAMQVQ